ncbi:monocarboxylate transporter 6 isoform X3 [Prionailurus iriomotensis]
MFENTSVCACGGIGTRLALEVCSILQATTECLLCAGGDPQDWARKYHPLTTKRSWPRQWQP